MRCFRFKYLIILLIAFVLTVSFFRLKNVIGSTKYIDPIYTVKTSTDIKYGEAVGFNGKTENLLLDIYEPNDEGIEKRPLIIFVHGGSFVAGDKTVYSENAVNMAKKGYVVSSINYRLDTTRANNPYNARSPDLEKPVGIAKEDTLTALGFFVENSAKYRIDTEKIFLGGSSAGAVTVLYTAFSEEMDAKKIKAVYSIAGTVLTDDLSIIDENDPSTIMFNGTVDDIVPYEMAQATVDKLKSKGVTAELVSYQGEGHSIISGQTTDIHKKLSEFLYKILSGNITSQTPIPTKLVYPTQSQDFYAMPTLPPETNDVYLPTITEDLNGDNSIDYLDVEMLIEGYFFGNMDVDLNQDGIINGYDYFQLYEKINR